MKRLKVVCMAMAITVSLATSAQAQQQSYPTKPVRLIVGFGAGGPTDLQARLLAEYLAPSLGQPIIVESRPGDGSVIAHRYVAQQPPDGYTLMHSGDYAAFFPSYFPNWDLDLLRDFSYLGTITTSIGNLLLTSANAPFNNMDEFIKYARANPGKVNWATVGVGHHTVFFRYLGKSFGLNIIEVPYKSSADAKIAVQRGDVAMYPDASSAAEDKTLKPIMFTSNVSHPLYPQIPTMKDGEVAKLGLTFNSYFALIGPANLPNDVVAKINGALATVAKSKAFIDREAPLGFYPRYTTPAEHREVMARDVALQTRIAKETGVAR